MAKLKMDSQAKLAMLGAVHHVHKQCKSSQMISSIDPIESHFGLLILAINDHQDGKVVPSMGF